MPVLKKTDRSIGVVMERLADPKRRHLVRPEDKEAAENLGKSMIELKKAIEVQYFPSAMLAEAAKKLTMHDELYEAAQEMREAVQRSMAPLVTGPGPTIIDQLHDMANIVWPKVNLMGQIFSDHISPLMQQSAEAHKHFAELREAFAPPTIDVGSLIALPSREPVEIIQPYTSAVRIENPEEIAVVLAKEMKNQIPPAPTVENPLALVECVYLGDELHLRILKFPVMVFEGLRANIIHFFYSDPYCGQWRSYNDMRQLGANAASIRQAIEDINKRVMKGTENKAKELIASRPVGSKRNSSKEYKYAL